VSAWRSRTDLGDELAREYGIAVRPDLAEAISEVDAVVVATDTDKHMPPALAAVRAGKALFLEKPVSHNRDGIDALVDAVKEKRVVVEVGCQLRAHPCLRELSGRLRSGEDGKVLFARAAVGQRLDAWRPDTDYRRCYSASRARGGGALMDLIHEIDLVLWLTGPVKSVAAATARVSDHEMDAEDLACLTLEGRAGHLAQIEMDMLSPVYRRTLEVVCERAVYRYDDVDGSLVRQDEAGSSVICRTPPGYERNTMFVEEMKTFLARVSDLSLPAQCPLGDGIAALEVALAGHESAAARKTVALPS
jgi:predicted dehydrogenase